MKMIKVTSGFKHRFSKGGYLHLMILTVGIGRNGFAIYLFNFWVSIVWVPKTSRLFYVKLNGEYFTSLSDVFTCDNIEHFGCKYKEHASTFTDSEYDLIKHLLPNDHTLELV